VVEGKGLGFSLVELVAVIVLVAIVASVAIPRFVDLESAAAESVLREVRARFKTAVNLVHGKSLIHREDDAFPDVSVGGDCIQVDPNSGFPVADQTSGSCDAVAALNFERYYRQLVVVPLKSAPPSGWGLLPRAHAIAPPPPPPPESTLPELLLNLDPNEWNWKVSGTTGTLTSPEGLSLVYDQTTGQID